MDRTEELVNEYLYSGNYPPVPEYLFAASSTLIWINWKKKNYGAMEDLFTKCIQLIENKILFSPFHFLYVLPMVALYFERNVTEKINSLMKDLLLPHQRTLEPDLGAIIDKCLEGEKGIPDRESVRTFLDLAKQYKYL